MTSTDQIIDTVTDDMLPLTAERMIVAKGDLQTYFTEAALRHVSWDEGTPVDEDADDEEREASAPCVIVDPLIRIAPTRERIERRSLRGTVVHHRATYGLWRVYADDEYGYDWGPEAYAHYPSLREAIAAALAESMPQWQSTFCGIDSSPVCDPTL